MLTCFKEPCYNILTILNNLPNTESNFKALGKGLNSIFLITLISDYKIFLSTL
jgi:hypothetical protein